VSCFELASRKSGRVAGNRPLPPAALPGNTVYF